MAMPPTSARRAAAVGVGHPLRLLTSSRLSLPPPQPTRLPLEEAIAARKSGRSFGAAPLPTSALATLLYLGNGIARATTAAATPGFQRNAPSSGNLGSIEIFPIVLRVDEVPAGIYHYDSLEHELVQLRSGHFGTWLAERALFQAELASAGVALVLTANFARLQAKYGERGYRLGLLDAGHVSQNLYLGAAALGLPVCAVGGFIDDEVDGALGLDGVERASVLMVVAGSPPD